MEPHPNEPEDDAMARHAAAFIPISDAPIRDDVQVTLLPEAMIALRAMWAAIGGAVSEILLEFYTFEDFEIDGVSLVDLLEDRARSGVGIAIVYDAVGSDGTPDAVFDRLRRAGARVLEFRPLNPFRERFSLAINDRDHRKILVVDRAVAFLGGTNLDRQYLNPRSAGIPADRDTRHAFWQDCAARFEGAAVEDTRALFLHDWTRHGGDAFPTGAPAPHGGSPRGPGERVCVEGSAPREGRPLHLRAMLAGLAASRDRVWLASGYFVPLGKEMRALVDAARRGVDVRLIVPGISDVMGAVHAGRGTYGRLLRAGVRIFEMQHAVLHAKVSTIDGVWSSIGSSNFDTRSAIMNNEVDAVILGRATAASVEDMMRAWAEDAAEITLRGWQDRSLHERFGELTALAWKRLM